MSDPIRYPAVEGAEYAIDVLVNAVAKDPRGVWYEAAEHYTSLPERECSRKRFVEGYSSFQLCYERRNQAYIYKFSTEDVPTNVMHQNAQVCFERIRNRAKKGL